jgi:hypothetical protein
LYPSISHHLLDLAIIVQIEQQASYKRGRTYWSSSSRIAAEERSASSLSLVFVVPWR